MTATFASTLAATMAERGLNDTQVANVLGTNQATVHRWRTGKMMPSPDRTVELAAFLGVSARKMDRLLTAGRPDPAPVGDPVDGETVGDIIRAVELARGMTASDHLRHIGMDKSRYHRLRNGDTVPRYSDIVSLAAQLGVRPERLVVAAWRGELAKTAPKQPARRSTRDELNDLAGKVDELLRKVSA